MISCRKAIREDIPVLQRITKELVEQNATDLSKGFIQNEFNKKDLPDTYVICHDNVPIGLVEVQPFSEEDTSFYRAYFSNIKSNSMYVGTMAIQKGYERQGFGEKLMHYVLEQTYGHDLFCDVAVSPVCNVASNQFFTKLGFQDIAHFEYLHEDGLTRTWALYGLTEREKLDENIYIS